MDGKLISTIVAIALILTFAYLYKKNAKKRAEEAKNNPDYKVPLSDDVQRIYYDKYEEELKKEKEAEEAAKQQAEAYFIDKEEGE